MANVNIARGLQPYKAFANGYVTGGMNVYCVPATDANNYFVGDPMIATGAADAFGVPVVARATAGASNYSLGPMVSIVNDPNNQYVVQWTSPVYRQASVLTYILVADDPSWMFEIQEDGAMTVATVGMKNANLVAGSGSTTTGFSGWQLQSSSVATTNTLQLRIVRMLQEADNAGGTNAKWLVKLNLHSFNNLTGI